MLGALYAVIGLIAGGIMTMFSLAGFAAAGGGQDGAAALLFGGGAIVLLPLFYGIMGFIGGIIMSFVYNVVAMMVGGIAVELEGTIFLPALRTRYGRSSAIISASGSQGRVAFQRYRREPMTICMRWLPLAFRCAALITAVGAGVAITPGCYGEMVIQLSGTVVDVDGNAVNDARISLLRAGDETVVAERATNSEGKFFLTVTEPATGGSPEYKFLVEKNGYEDHIEEFAGSVDREIVITLDRSRDESP